MLILSRRTGQGIRIGDAIRVTVVAIDGQFVRLGLEAPPAYKILRDELWRTVANDNRAALAAAPLAQEFARLVQQQPESAAKDSSSRVDYTA